LVLGKGFKGSKRDQKLVSTVQSPEKKFSAVHGHRQPQLEVFVEHFSPKGNSLTEHVDGHEAEGFPVHQEPVGVDGGQAVNLRHVPDPGLDVLTKPASRVWK